jgi:hypothetical protein
MPHDLKLKRPRRTQNTSNQPWRSVYWSVLYCSGMADSTLTFGIRRVDFSGIKGLCGKPGYDLENQCHYLDDLVTMLWNAIDWCRSLSS